MWIKGMSFWVACPDHLFFLAGVHNKSHWICPNFPATGQVPILQSAQSNRREGRLQKWPLHHVACWGAVGRMLLPLQSSPIMLAKSSLYHVIPNTGLKMEGYVNSTFSYLFSPASLQPDSTSQVNKKQVIHSIAEIPRALFFPRGLASTRKRGPKWNCNYIMLLIVADNHLWTQLNTYEASISRLPTFPSIPTSPQIGIRLL